MQMVDIKIYIPIGTDSIKCNAKYNLTKSISIFHTLIFITLYYKHYVLLNKTHWGVILNECIQ